MNAATATPSLEPDSGWMPSKGVVGMTCLIIAESAIFTIFVVAYLFYWERTSAARLRGKCSNCRF